MRRLVSVVPLAFLLVGCGGPLWQVVKLDPANPLANASTFYVAPVELDGAQIEGKPESEWLARRNDKQRASWQEDKSKYTAAFLDELHGKGLAMISKGRTYMPLEGQAPQGAFVVHVKIAQLGDEQWFTASIASAANQVIDEVRIGGRASYWGFAPMLAGSRAMLAERLDRYLRDRAAGKIQPQN